MNNEKFENRCERLISKVRSKFPELKNIKLNLEVKELKNSSMRAKKTIFGRYILIIDPIKYEYATDEQIAGCLPHEFVHFAQFTKLNFFKKLYLSLRYRFSKAFKTKYEKKTDRETIQRGFARQLYANRQFRIKNSSLDYKARVLRFYLTPEQIKAYAKKIGKW